MNLIKNILVPTDFSHHSSHAINYACDVAASFGATLHLLNVAKNGADQSSRIRILEQLGNVIDARRELSISTVKESLHGDAKTQIINYIDQNRIDAVVMGTHGRTGLAHLAMGSVAESVVREASCPVTVLGPRDGENASGAQVAEVIAKLVESGLPADEEKARTQILKSIVEHLRVSSTSAILMLNEVMDDGWVQVQDGIWTVADGLDLLGDPEPIVFDTESESQAVELIRRAAALRATDIHIDPCKNEFLVRLRIDGHIVEYCRLDKHVGEHLINQCKTLARIDYGDPFHICEARMLLPEHLQDIEVRLTSVPVPEGQAIALRFLDPARLFKPLGDLGFSETQLASVDTILDQGEGLVLVTGPTGSGKTTTVYSMLESIGGLKKNIVSIEDPVEFSAPFVRQISVDQKHGITMADGLRTLLRMDPDTLFIGEIRDADTAEIGMRAATGGMYVFTTLHTRDIASAIFSFENFNVSRSSIVSHLAGIVNQRLLRQLCSRCRQETDTTASQAKVFQTLGLEIPEKLFEPGKCSHCSGTGYYGRTGIFEILATDDEVRESLRRMSTRQEVHSLIRSRGVTGLHADALRKAAAGKISFNDANSACSLV